MATIYTFLFYIILCCIAVVDDTSCQVLQALIYIVTSNLVRVNIFWESIQTFDRAMQGLRSSIHYANEYLLPLKFYIETFALPGRRLLNMILLVKDKKYKLI